MIYVIGDWNPPKHGFRITSTPKYALIFLTRALQVVIVFTNILAFLGENILTMVMMLALPMVTGDFSEKETKTISTHKIISIDVLLFRGRLNLNMYLKIF